MHIVSVSLHRAIPEAVPFDADAFTQEIMTMEDSARVEHVRAVVAAFRVHVVLFLLAPTYSEAHASALRVCRRALISAAFTGWAVEDDSA